MTLDLRKRLLAILAADVAGYSRLMALDDRATVSMLDSARTVFRHQVGAHGGRVVDMAGDSVLAVFETASGAMTAALAVQRVLGRASADVPAPRRLQFRIGIHVGDVIEKEDGSVYGDGVNIAARLEGLAEPGCVAVSQAVHGMVARSAEAEFEDIGEQAVKNIAEPVRAFRVRGRADTDATPAHERASALTRAVRGNLPEAPSTLVGREGDLAAVSELARLHRLVTLVGAGGIGKTRLGLALAHALGDEFADGAWLVELAPVAEGALLAGAVAQALGIALSGRKPPQDEVLDALESRALLIVLDNCEHLVAAAGSFAAMLVARSARTRLVATSQEALHVGGEHVYRLDTLAVPVVAKLPGARAYGAVALFDERVRSLLPQFVLDPRNIDDVVAVCAALDGLPLAIELAAARVPLLGVSGVRQHVHERFRLLTRGSRVAERRHQTLREALDWSHGLLGDEERTVFRRLGAFSGGFTLPAAQHVGADAGLDLWRVLDDLGALVDKSLVVVDEVEPRRYRLLESAREYAFEKLAQSGEGPDVRDRHAAFYLSEARAAEPHLTSAGRQPWRDRLRAESGNLRSAMAWLVRERKDAASALGLAGSLAWFAYFEGLFDEWRRWLADALSLPLAQSFPRDHALALSGAARLAAYSGDTAAAKTLVAESIRLWREVGDVRGLAYALFHEGVAFGMSNQWEHGKVALRESLASFRQLDDAWGIALGSTYLGTAYSLSTDSEDEARELMVEGRAKFRALGDDWGASVSSHYLGSMALRRGDFATARELSMEMLVNARATGDRYRVSRNLYQIVEIDLGQGLLADAARGIHESLAMTCQQGRIGDAAQVLRLAARVASHCGDGAAACRLAAVADRHAGAERTMPPDDPRRHAELLAQLRALLGARYDDEVAAGAELSLEQATALVATLAARSS
ncbi:MAG: adenylate/guanylate cyclase domain-containing protein [Caldimonas sp.]